MIFFQINDVFFQNGWTFSNFQILFSKSMNFFQIHKIFFKIEELVLNLPTFIEFSDPFFFLWYFFIFSLFSTCWIIWQFNLWPPIITAQVSALITNHLTSRPVNHPLTTPAGERLTSGFYSPSFPSLHLLLIVRCQSY